MKPPLVGARVVFAGDFESDFSFTLRERRSPTLEKIQTDALEIEETMTVAGKTQEKQSVQEKGKAKEESPQDQRIDDMTKVIKNLSNKLVNMELENKNSQRPTQQNKGVYNPQFRNQPLQILQRERKDQDQVQAPLHIEATPSQSTEDDQREVKDQIYAIYMKEDEEEEESEEEYTKVEVSFDQEEMDDYCRQFTNFMQAELHKKYDLR